jgi:phosphate transport system substrate-binding protein
VQGVEGDRYSLGYFGFAYYWENRQRLRAVAVDGGSGCVMPTDQTINTNEYAPLSRPLFIYVSRASLERPAVLRFVEFYLRHAAELVPQTGYIALPDADYQQGLDRLGGAGG